MLQRVLTPGEFYPNPIFEKKPDPTFKKIIESGSDPRIISRIRILRNFDLNKIHLFKQILKERLNFKGSDLDVQTGS